MALRTAKLLGERATVFEKLRWFTTSRQHLQQVDDVSQSVKGPGGSGSVSGTKDMNVGDRESVTEGAESPKDVADTLKQHDDASKTDSTGDLNRKPVGQADKEQVREDIAGSSP